MLEHLQNSRGVTLLWLAEEHMHVFGHDHITEYTSGNQIGLGFETPLGPEPISGELEVGTTTQGVSALKDAVTEIRNSLTIPGLPPTPKPPPPPPTCAGDQKKTCR